MTEAIDRPIAFAGIDGFNRPIFKRIMPKGDMRKFFYGSTHKLFDLVATEAEVLAEISVDDLCFFGNSFGCEPDGTPVVAGLRIIKREEAKEMRK
jgi:hypothetical protein